MRIKGLTLVELLITVSIVSLLASVVFMSINDARIQSRDAKRVVEVDQIEKAIVAYSLNNNGVPPGVAGIEYVNGNPEWIPGLVPKYISELPSDPIDKDEFKYRYMRQGTEYIVAAQLEVASQENDCSSDGTCSYHQKSSANIAQIVSDGAAGWKFSNSSDVVSTAALAFTCPYPGEQVEICHREGGNTTGQTLTVSCTAVGPLGHSNHDLDTLGACSEPEPVPEPEPEPEPAPEPEPEPEPEPVDLSLLTIRGQFVHAFTGDPVANVDIKGVVPPSTLLTTLLTANTDGTFEFTATTDDVTTAKVKPHSYRIPCYMYGQIYPLAGIGRNQDQSLKIYTNHFDLIKSGSLYRDPLTTSLVDLGKVPLRPAKTILINSDIPVKFTIPFTEESGSVGNSLYKLSHKLSDVVPLDYDVIVKLTDEQGTVYTSPVQRYAQDAGCADAILNLENGEVTWVQ